MEMDEEMDYEDSEVSEELYENQPLENSGIVWDVGNENYFQERIDRIFA